MCNKISLVKKYDLIQQLKFMRVGSDMPRMLKKQMKGEIDSWAIRWCFNQFLRGQLTVFPKLSKVKNIGFGVQATHTKRTKRFNTNLDKGSKRAFSFDESILVNDKVANEFRNKFSFRQRLIDRISKSMNSIYNI